jgi:hypothetical protein
MARFFSIKNSLAVVSAAVLLAACGSGSSSYVATEDLPAITVSTDTQNTAEQYAALLLNKTAALPAGVIFTEAGAPTVTSGTTFTFTPVPTGAPANAISGFTLNNAQGTFSGYIAAGSTILCGKGTWNGVTYPTPPDTGDANGNVCFTINGNMVLDPNTNKLTAGSQTIDITVTITGAGFTPTTSTVTTTVTVTFNSNGTATISDPTTGTNFTVDTAEVTGAAG